MPADYLAVRFAYCGNGPCSSNVFSPRKQREAAVHRHFELGNGSVRSPSSAAATGRTRKSGSCDQPWKISGRDLAQPGPSPALAQGGTPRHTNRRRRRRGRQMRRGRGHEIDAVDAGAPGGSRGLSLVLPKDEIAADLARGPFIKEPSQR
jgi:hypothetical protein